MSYPIEGLALTEQQIGAAWLYVFGRYLVIRQEHIDLAEPGVTYNSIKHNPAVLGDTDAGHAPTFVNPNLDVVYSEAWIAVDENTPAILTVPKIPTGTYYTAQVVDEWAEILENINERVIPGHPNGTFAFVLAGSNPAIPADAYRIELPSAKAKLLVRVQIKDSVETASALCKQFTLESIGSPSVDSPIDLPIFPNTRPLGAEFFAEPRLKLAMAAPDQSGTYDQIAPTLKVISDFVAAGETQAQAFDTFILTSVFPTFVAQLTKLSVPKNGWTTTGDRKNFGTDVAFRTAANFGGIWWNSSTEVIYLFLHTDSEGNVPDGSKHYAQHFSSNDLPGKHVNGYWSITLYSDPELKLVPNPDNRFRISYASHLETDADGGFTIHYAPTLPPGIAKENWLPTPPGARFALNFRTYLPKEEVRNQSWSPPVVTPM